MSLLLALSLPVCADSANADARFAADGSCAVTLTLEMHLSSAEESLEFPLPKQARSITVNGSKKCTTHADDHQLWLKLPVSDAGKQTFTICYQVDGLLSKEKSATQVTLPLLSGCRFSLDQLTFAITLPSQLSAQPQFTSDYYQQNLDSFLDFSFDGTTITGQFAPVKDHETLVMTLEVPKDYFRDTSRHFKPLDKWDLVMTILIFLSVLYYALTLMPKFPGRARRTTPPDDIHAGDVGTCLTGCGTDLTMLLLSWAQRGYLLIELDKNRVTLHKLMDMGNERTSHEVRWFNSLFGQRTMIDADSYHYAKLCRKLAIKSPLLSQLYHKKSGNPIIFRLLCCITGIIAGLQMGLGMGDSAGAQTVLAMTFGCLCGIFSFFIQSGGKCLPLREKTPLWTALGCGVAWLALGVLSGDLQQAMPMVVLQFLAGIAAAYGGKRSELGMIYLRQIRGMRRHMLTASTFDLQQLMQKNPYYFYDMAPFALTLGVDRAFAHRFGKLLLPEDTYLLCSDKRSMTASQFASRLRKATDILNQRQKQLPYEQFKRK